ncbi:unnamed protein product [Pseudo-nitzschia multistriata]|uniref:Uncharacterized protein n=1 Tax=Pseudo-nitzschia multistriata TaxID=183589 RepID=A0A448ZQG6_9STRA|nr:unnamed protein product [Pseudo-nitzschia multistriata]
MLAMRSPLLLTLVLSAAAPSALAWNPTPASPLATKTHRHAVAKKAQRTSATFLAASGDGVLDFVKGLDSVLGNPTAYSAAEAASNSWASSVGADAAAASASGGGVSMNVPNEVVIGGGVLVFATVLGVAFVALSQKEDEADEEEGGRYGNESFGAGDVTPLPKRTETAPATSATESKLEEANTAIQKLTSENGTLIDQLSDAEEDNGRLAGEVESQGGLLAKLKARLSKTTEELETSQEKLESETALRKETESRLTEATTANEGLTESLETKEKALVEATEKWNWTKTKLEMETQEKESMKKELRDVAETNRVLEDKYELEQNALKKARTQLDSTRSTLESTQNRLTRTQGELTRYHSELQETKATLWKTSVDLENLEDEQKSLRILGGKMWRLSKQKVSNRVRAVGDRIKHPRRRKQKKRRN